MSCPPFRFPCLILGHGILHLDPKTEKERERDCSNPMQNWHVTTLGATYLTNSKISHWVHQYMIVIYLHRCVEIFVDVCFDRITRIITYVHTLNGECSIRTILVDSWETASGQTTSWSLGVYWRSHLHLLSGIAALVPRGDFCPSYWLLLLRV